MPAPSSQLQQVTSDTFWEFVQGNRLAIVHFWAAWNGQDFLMNKVLEQVPAELSKDVAIAQLDVDPAAHQKLCRDHDVLNVPFLAFYRNGRLVRTLTGMRTPQVITDYISELDNE